MSEKRPRTLDEIIGRLPTEVAPPDDLWPRIEAELARPSVDSLARELPTEVAPPVDVWPQIEARVRRPPRGRKLAIAAAVAAGVAAIVIATALREQTGAPSDTPSTAQTLPREAANEDVAPWWLGQMPPAANDVAAALSRDLALVRGEREAIERAIDAHPADGHLQDLWGYTYAAERRLEIEANRVMLTYERGYGI